MSKILAVFGATGQQGSSVVNYVLNDPELSKVYKIRAITRDVDSQKVQKLKGKAEIVYGDVHDRASLETALTGVHTVFAMTVPSWGPGAVEAEYNSGKTIADVAVEKGIKYIIFSTLPSVTEISGGKFTSMTPFDAKAKIEKYIRSLPVKSAFYAPGGFMENFQAMPFMTPQKTADGTWAITRHISPKTKIPLVDAIGDTGKFIGAILAAPDKYAGKTFYAGIMYSQEEIASAIAKATGKTVVYKQVSPEELRKTLPAVMADNFLEAFGFQEEFGGFGPESEEKAAWSTANARGRLTTLEEYLEAHPPQLT
ncbi:uncharacterized protein GGS25DRAFT_506113 [Hypoxylon fragiforme]|uniref:uncharacterized protein n=1 Tax=Hypoxylon fragiforme TaxID=63214 RepID=UPI0020C721EC|nr:uncharacterized protein GGS25DRAFT_506113 [Hypoxylon fragiforme]KAI2603906.1 hypothetical protein GGS25DRAFT_506113 [Hypoxylon fragiforme]